MCCRMRKDEVGEEGVAITTAVWASALSRLRLFSSFSSDVAFVLKLVHFGRRRLVKLSRRWRWWWWWRDVLLGRHGHAQIIHLRFMLPTMQTATNNLACSRLLHKVHQFWWYIPSTDKSFIAKVGHQKLGFSSEMCKCRDDVFRLFISSPVKMQDWKRSLRSSKDRCQRRTLLALTLLCIIPFINFVGINQLRIKHWLELQQQHGTSIRSTSRLDICWSRQLLHQIFSVEVFFRWLFANEIKKYWCWRCDWYWFGYHQLVCGHYGACAICANYLSLLIHFSASVCNVLDYSLLEQIQN